MSIRELFSLNLREHFQQRGKVTSVSRATGISRVQLNRYLSGTVPNAENLGILSQHLGIDEIDLFQDRSRRRADVDLTAFLQLAEPAFQFVAKEKEVDFPEGIYYAYFPAAEVSTQYFRALLFVKKIHGFTTFRRYTKITTTRASGARAFNSQHRGIVVQRKETLYFVGINHYAAHEPSMLAATPLPIAVAACAGRAVVMSTTGVITSQFAVLPAEEGLSTRELIQNTGRFDIWQLPDADVLTGIFAKTV